MTDNVNPEARDAADRTLMAGISDAFDKGLDPVPQVTPELLDNIRSIRKALMRKAFGEMAAGQADKEAVGPIEPEQPSTDV